uniref:EF-hand domain-containing protein n=1 Tax=Macrostomum lignano TaxID=282301 RepID=A0A1I8FQ94_9PLAT
LHIVDEEGRQSVGTVGPLHPQVVRHGNKEAVLHTEHALLRAVVHMALEHRGHDCGRDLQDQHQADQTGVLRNLGWWGRAAVGGTARLFNTGKIREADISAEPAQKSKELSGSKSAGRATQLTIISRHLDSFIAPQQPQKPTSRVDEPEQVVLVDGHPDAQAQAGDAEYEEGDVEDEENHLGEGGSSSRPFGIETAARRHRRLAVSMGKPDSRLISRSLASIQVGERTNPSGLTGSQSTRVATGLSVVEVERLVAAVPAARLHLRGPHHQRGVLRGSGSMYSEDTFLRKFIGYLRDDFRSDGKVTFQNFCNAMYWIEKGHRQRRQTKRSCQDHSRENDSGAGPTDRLGDTLMGAAAGSGHRRRWRQRRPSRNISQDSFACSTAWTASPRGRLEALLAFNVIPRHRPGPTGARAGPRLTEAAGSRRAKRPQRRRRSGGRCEAVYPRRAGLTLSWRWWRSGASRRTTGCSATKLGFYESDMNQIENLLPRATASAAPVAVRPLLQRAT